MNLLFAVGLLIALVAVFLEYFRDFYWGKVTIYFPRLTKKTFSTGLLIFTVLGLLLSTISSLISEKRFNDYKDYSYYAFLNIEGRKNEAGVFMPTRVSSEMEGILLLNGTIGVRCGVTGILGIEGLIDRFPYFPFGHYFKTQCLLERGDSHWVVSAKEAKRILKITTQIQGHNPHHDFALNKIKEALSGASKTITPF